MVAVNQVGIATELINTLLVGVVGALALAAGLAFGLGGRDRAAEILDRVGRRTDHAGPRLERSTAPPGEPSRSGGARGDELGARATGRVAAGAVRRGLDAAVGAATVGGCPGRGSTGGWRGRGSGRVTLAAQCSSSYVRTGSATWHGFRFAPGWRVWIGATRFAASFQGPDQHFSGSVR